LIFERGWERYETSGEERRKRGRRAPIAPMWRCEGNGWVETCHVDGGNETKAIPDGLDWIECPSVWQQSQQHNTRQDTQVSKQSAQLNRACLCPLVLLCGPGYVAATEPPALLCLLAQSVDPRSDLLCSGLRSLSLVRLWILYSTHCSLSIFNPVNERTDQRTITVHDNQYQQHNTTQPKPQPAPTLCSHCALSPPPLLQPPHHDNIGNQSILVSPTPSKS